MQSLAGINIPEAGNELLVEERSFKGGALRTSKPGKCRSVKRVAEGLDSGTAEQRMSGKGMAWNEQHEAETARIIVDDTGTGREVEDDVIMRGIFRCGLGSWKRPLPIRCPFDAKRARHAKVHNERFGAVEIGD
jgi:hypothetical protein